MENKILPLDHVKDELLAMGMTKAQAESRVVPAVISILTNNPDIYNAAKHYEESELMKHNYQSMSSQIDNLELSIEALTIDRNSLERFMREHTYLDHAVDVWKDAELQIKKFNESLSLCDCDESRDLMRKAQFFIQNVDVLNESNNTAFISGLAAILSGEKCGVIPTNLGKIKLYDEMEGR